MSPSLPDYTHLGLNCWADFYLPYTGLKALASANPENGLLAGRGPPGTHDTALLSSTLAAVRSINASSTAVQLPIFDKSQNEGYGDRSTSTVPVKPPVEVFLLEGWSLGFEPISSEDLEARWKAGRVASTHPLESMRTINDNLRQFSQEVHHHFDVHIGIRPKSYDYVYEWRLQQEHHMKRVNGGKGMSDDAVRAFVDRYMPCYELYGAQKVARAGMVLEFGEKREVGRIEES